MLRYVPIFRYRQEERKGLLKVDFDNNKIIPLIELVTELPRAGSKKTTIEALVDDLAEIDKTVMVEIPQYIRLRSIKNTVLNFLSKCRNPATRHSYLNQLPKHLIPVVSYDPNSIWQNGQLSNEYSALKKFPRKAIRIFVNQFAPALAEAQTVITSNDILLFDIDRAGTKTLTIQSMFSAIKKLKKQTNCETVVIHTPLDNTITNSGLQNGQPILQADNSLLKNHTKFGFDAFGDYCGVKKDLLTDGGTISPGFIFYSWKDNQYYGFTSAIKTLAHFEITIAPDLVASPQWSWYGKPHHGNCLGCKTVTNISNRTEPGQSQAKWKGIALAHYLFTMNDSL